MLELASAGLAWAYSSVRLVVVQLCLVPVGSAATDWLWMTSLTCLGPQEKWLRHPVHSLSSPGVPSPRRLVWTCSRGGSVPSEASWSEGLEDSHHFLCIVFQSQSPAQPAEMQGMAEVDSTSSWEGLQRSVAILNLPHSSYFHYKTFFFKRFNTGVP